MNSTKAIIPILTPSEIESRTQSGLFILHEGWVTPVDTYEDRRQLESLQPGKNGFRGIPLTLFSVETLIFMGLTRPAAQVVWDSWSARDEEIFPAVGGPLTAFLGFVLQMAIDYPGNHTAVTDEEWAALFTSCEQRFNAKFMANVYSQGVYHPHTRLLAVEALAMQRWAHLLRVRSESVEREMRMLADREDDEGVFVDEVIVL